MSWNIKTPGDYINGPLTVAGAVTLNSTLSIGGETRIRSGNQLRVYRSDNAIYSSIEDAGSGIGLVLNNLNGDGFRLRITGNNVYNVAGDGTYTQTWLNGAGSEWMRLNATGLGIGVSPAFKLSAAGVSQFYADSDGIYASGNSSPDLYTIGVNYYNAAGTEGVKVSARPSWKIEHKNSNDALAYFDIGFRAASAAASAFTSRFKIDGFGNIGFGVTPQSWGSNWKAIDIAGGGRLYAVSGTGTHGLCFNGYNNNTNWLYHFSTAASRFELQQSGNFAWFTAPSGTAGNAITWTQAMTLDSAGSLLLGTTSSPTGTKIGSIAKLSGVSVEGTNYINVSTTQVPIARSMGTGGLFFVAGYNTTGGAQGWWLVASTGASVATVIASGNNTTLTVAFTQVSGVLHMNTTSGTVAVTALSITN